MWVKRQYKNQISLDDNRLNSPYSRSLLEDLESAPSCVELKTYAPLRSLAQAFESSSPGDLGSILYPQIDIFVVQERIVHHEVHDKSEKSTMARTTNYIGWELRWCSVLCRLWKGGTLATRPANLAPCQSNPIQLSTILMTSIHIMDLKISLTRFYV